MCADIAAAFQLQCRALAIAAEREGAVEQEMVIPPADMHLQQIDLPSQLRLGMSRSREQRKSG
ncbi:hypothetical protein [Novosphingobium sp. PP1Y]|uniref:hypothetical protein n=1 Tax=Novosphingobium sp. PP1Y TaxID=702113 RepID=UPI0005A27357|nr:hypothetical protein [Novosphingobium sp. PP1Y]